MAAEIDWTKRLSTLATEADVPGAVLGIWSGVGQVVAAFGVLNRSTGVEVTEDSVFHVGSITKLWTATMVMQLVDEGRLSLDDTLASLLPDAPVAAAGSISVRHLLSHTSGIDGDVFTDTGRGDDCVEKYVRLLGTAAQVSPPGAAYSYCNAGFVVLGRIIESLDQRTWDESLRARLIEPLGLAATLTLPEEALMHRAALGHVAAGTPVHQWQLPRSLAPAGLITQSAGDMLAFARLHLSRGGDLLTDEAASALVEPAVAIPAASGGHTHVGLAFRIYDWSGRRVIGHDGVTMAQFSFLRIDPEADLAVSLLTNSDNAPALSERIISEVFEHYTGVRMPPTPQPAVGVQPRDLPGLKEHVGRYERAGVAIDVTLSEEGLNMIAEATGDRLAFAEEPRQEYRLLPADRSGTRFLTRETNRQPWEPIAFARQLDGTPYLFTSDRVTPKVS